MFPIAESGFLTEVQNVVDVDGHPNYIKGNLYYREYENNRIHILANGRFVATKDYVAQFSNSEYAPASCAA
jgi:hypothetical protein